MNTNRPVNNIELLGEQINLLIRQVARQQQQINFLTRVIWSAAETSHYAAEYELLYFPLEDEGVDDDGARIED